MNKSEQDIIQKKWKDPFLLNTEPITIDLTLTSVNEDVWNKLIQRTFIPRHIFEGRDED